MTYEKLEPKRLKHIQREVYKLGNQRLPLTDWLHQASNVDSLVSQAIEGIYCGREGRIHEQLGGTRYWIVASWYVDPYQYAEYGEKPKIETSYVS